MELLIRLTTRHAWKVIALVVLLSAGAAALLVRPGVELDPNPFLLKRSHPSRVAYDRMQRTFDGTLESALIHLRHPQTVFNPQTLARVKTLTERFRDIRLTGGVTQARLDALAAGVPGDLGRRLAEIVGDGLQPADLDPLLAMQGELDFADAAGAEAAEPVLETLVLRLDPVKDVTSLADVQNILGAGDELIIREVYDDVPRDPRALARLRAEVTGNDLFRGTLVSEDLRSTAIQVETWIPVERGDLMYELYERLQAIVDAVPGESTVYVAGIPIAAATMTNIMREDVNTFFPIVFVLVLGALYLTFRTFSGVLLPLAVVLVSIVFTMAAMAVAGVPLNNITTALPVFLITIGVADGIHMVSTFRDALRETADRHAATVQMMRHMVLPVVMTSVTTTAGFLSLTYTEIANIKVFGIFVSVGVIMAMIASLVLIPAVLARLGGRGPQRRRRPDAPGPTTRLETAAVHALEAVARGAVRHRLAVLAVAAVLAALSAVGMTRVVVENDFMTYVDAERPIIQASNSLDRHLAGSNAVNVLLHAAEAAGDEPFKQPRYLAAAQALQDHLAQSPLVGRSASLTDLLRRMNYVMHGQDPAYDRLPRETEQVSAGDGDGAGTVATSGRNLIGQYLLLYEGGGGNAVDDYVADGYRSLNVSVSLRTNNSTEISALMADTRRWAQEHLPPELSLRFAGYAELAVASNTEVVRGQIGSFSLSLAVILVLLLLQFRVVSKALLGIVPLLFTVLLNFGTMGWFHIPLNVGTAIVSSIVIGIGVDYAIHYLTRLDGQLRAGHGVMDAFARTMTHSGKAITANAITVSLGFLALTLSGFVPLQQVGWMVSQTLLVSAVATLVLLPALTRTVQPAFLAPRTGPAAEPLPDGA